MNMNIEKKNVLFTPESSGYRHKHSKSKRVRIQLTMRWDEDEQPIETVQRAETAEEEIQREETSWETEQSSIKTANEQAERIHESTEEIREERDRRMILEMDWSERQKGDTWEEHVQVERAKSSPPICMFNNWLMEEPAQVQQQPVGPVPCNISNQLPLLPPRFSRLHDYFPRYHRVSSKDSLSTDDECVPSVEHPAGVEELEPQPFEAEALLGLMSEDLRHRIRCEIIQHFKENSATPKTSTFSHEVNLCIPSGSYGFSLGTGGVSRLIWPSECLVMLCPAVKSSNFRKMIANPLDTNPQVRHPTGWELLCIQQKMTVSPEDLLLFFKDRDTRDSFFKEFRCLRHVPLGLLPGFNPCEKQQPQYFWHIRWVCVPLSKHDSQAVLKLRHSSDVDWCMSVLEANNLCVAKRTLRHDLNNPNYTRQLYIIYGLPDVCTTNGLLDDYVGAILKANKIAYESVLLTRKHRHNNYPPVPIERELAKIRKRLWMESNKLDRPLSPQIRELQRNYELLQYIEFFEDTKLDWPFDVKKGELQCRAAVGKMKGQQFYDMTGIPVDKTNDATAQIIWHDQFLAEIFTAKFAELTPSAEAWHMRNGDQHGVRLTFGCRASIPVAKSIRAACHNLLMELDEHLRSLEYPPSWDARDEFVKRERFWAQLVDESTFDSIQGDSTVVINVEGYPKRLFEEALAATKRILSGTKVDCSDFSRHGRLLYGFGKAWLESELEKLGGCVVTDVDFVRKTLTLFGEPDIIDSLLRRVQHFLDNSSSYFVETKLELVPPHYSATLPAVLNLLGFNKLGSIVGGARFEAVKEDKEEDWKTLKFAGSLIQYERLTAFLDGLLDTFSAALTRGGLLHLQPQCPVCLCSVSSPSFILSACRHTYCLECFINLISNKVMSRELEFVCIKEDCSQPIELSDILKIVLGEETRMKSLDAQKLEPLLRALKDKAACKDSEYLRICPSADCYGLMSVELSEIVNKDVQCKDCKQWRCAAKNCMLPPHPGEDCEQAKRVRDDVDESLRRYMERIGVNKLKQCPSCTIVIEKQLGCNHMECTRCRIHFCWLCGFQHTERSGLYAHLGAVHRSYGGDFPNEVQEQALNDEALALALEEEQRAEDAAAERAAWRDRNARWRIRHPVQVVVRREDDLRQREEEAHIVEQMQRFTRI